MIKNLLFPVFLSFTISSMAQELIPSKTEWAYNNYITLGDSCFKTNHCACALENYEKAQKLYPDWEQAKARIKKVNEYMATDGCGYMDSKKQKYDENVAYGDKLFSERKWEEAKVKYETALTIIVNDPHAKAKIEECNKMIVAENQYHLNKKKGDEKFSKKEWETAIACYEKALTIKPIDSYAKSQIEKCKKEIQFIKELKEKEYQEYMKTSDMYMKQGDYDKAIEAYFDALGRKPDDPVAKDGIDTAIYLKNRKN